MRHHRIAWMVAATAITVAPLIPAEAAAASPAGAPAPAGISVPQVVRHASTDVDGDGTRDAVTLTYLGADQFALSAVTTKGKSSSISFTSHVNEGAVPAAKTWYGADAIDGRKGSELIVHRYAPTVTESGQNLDIAVYTWRSGQLVAEPAPASPSGTGWQVGVTEGSEAAAGYWFFTSHGRRYADTTRLSLVGGSPRYTGSLTRSVWRSGKWVKVWTRSAKATSLTWKQVGMAGPKLLRSQVKADINGDGRTDLALIYQLGLNHYRATVLAHGHRASADVTSWTDPLIGAAAVDGVAGDELIASSVKDGRWTVLTWRHSGRLTALKAPALYGRAGNTSTWHRASSGGPTNFTTSVESGRHYVVTAFGPPTSVLGSDAVRYAKSVWEKGRWTKLAEWTATLTQEQWASFHDGFTAPDLVSP